MNAHIAEVIVDVRTRALNRTFDYVIPAAWVGRLSVGHRVYVSFGKQFCQAYVVNIREGVQESTLKPILEILDEDPILTEELMALCNWLCYRNGCTTMEAITAVLPGGFRIEQRRVYEAVDTSNPPISGLAETLWQAVRKEPLSFHQLAARYGTDAVFTLEHLIASGLIQERMAHRDKVLAKTEPVLRALCTPEELKAELNERSKKARKQSQILAELLSCEELDLKQHGLRPSDGAVKALISDGLVELLDREVYRTPEHLTMAGMKGVGELTVWQERALQTICHSLSNPKLDEIVVHGVTGSGKTEVYLRAIAACIEAGRGAAVLVPEISLTPQMVNRFVDRFGSRVAVLHSALSAGEKRDEWVRIRRGEATIAIGARSAVFAPVRNLSLIIIDEEHESSYKQDETPRYDARDTARWRMEYDGGTLVLGSATPSLQTMRTVETGAASIVTLPQRVNGRPLPPVEIVDMRDELKSGNRSIFSHSVQHGLASAIDSGHQAILFLNRRGYASFLLCRNCGEVPECPSCDISLTLHRGRHGQWLRCHYCGYVEEATLTCKACGEEALRPYGVGTQQVEQMLSELNPSWRVLRMDVDTTRRKGSHQAVIQKFLEREADILLGTQMVAKGLDFPNVSFVGVISADTMLSVPDYRSSERTFQLLTQVAGRAGRADVSGRTVIQTYRPDHYSIQAAARHDYAEFYRIEREMREAFQYPPFCEITVFTAIHTERKLAEGAAKRFERELKRRLAMDEVVVLPAVPAGVERVEDKYRFQVVVKYSVWNRVREAVIASYELLHSKLKAHSGTCTLDVNAGRLQ